MGIGAIGEVLEQVVDFKLAPDEAKQRDAIVAAIYDAFAHVRRGPEAISWSETDVMDGGGSEPACLEARRRDTDTNWQSLVNDPKWEPFTGVGGFSFINPEGFHYYLPPTLVRFLQRTGTDMYPGQLANVLDNFYKMVRWSDTQLRVIAWFIAFMAKHDPDSCFYEGVNVWEQAIKHRWFRHLPKSEPGH